MLVHSCGAMTHNAKLCMDQGLVSWDLRANWTSKNIAPDKKIDFFELDYDGKRERWNGYDVASCPCH